MPESKRCAQSTFAAMLATHLLLRFVIVLQILDIIKKHPAVSVQDSLAAAFDPSNIAQQNEAQASQLHHPQQPSQPSTQLQHRPLHADVAIMKQALQVF